MLLPAIQSTLRCRFVPLLSLPRGTPDPQLKRVCEVDFIAEVEIF